MPLGLLGGALFAGGGGDGKDHVGSFFPLFRRSFATWIGRLPPVPDGVPGSWLPPGRSTTVHRAHTQYRAPCWGSECQRVWPARTTSILGPHGRGGCPRRCRAANPSPPAGRGREFPFHLFANFRVPLTFFSSCRTLDASDFVLWHSTSLLSPIRPCVSPLRDFIGGHGINRIVVDLLVNDNNIRSIRRVAENAWLRQRNGSCRGGEGRTKPPPHLPCSGRALRYARRSRQVPHSK